MRFRARTDDNRKLVVNWDHINLYLSRRKPGTLFEIEIKPFERKISDPLRRYYWSTVLPPLLKELGYEPHEDELVHNQLKILFFNCEPDERGIYRNVPSVFGNQSDEPISRKQEFIEYVKRIAVKYGVYIPDVNEIESRGPF